MVSPQDESGRERAYGESICPTGAAARIDWSTDTVRIDPSTVRAEEELERNSLA